MNSIHLGQGLLWFLPGYLLFNLIRSRMLFQKDHLLHTHEQFLYMASAQGIMIFGSSFLRLFWTVEKDMMDKLGVGAAVFIITTPILYWLMEDQAAKNKENKDFLPTLLLNVFIIFGGAAFDVMMLNPAWTETYPKYTVCMMFIQCFSLMFSGFALRKARVETIKFLYYMAYPIIIFAIDFYLFEKLVRT